MNEVEMQQMGRRLLVLRDAEAGECPRCGMDAEDCAESWWNYCPECGEELGIC